MNSEAASPRPARTHMRARAARWRARRDRTARLLQRIDVFSECTRRQLRAVGRRLYPVVVQGGHVLVRSGEACEELVVVIEGEAETRAPDGRRGSLGAGSVFGEAAVLPGSAQVITVAATTSMLLLVASRTELSEIVRVSPSVERNLLRRVAMASNAEAGRRRSDADSPLTAPFRREAGGEGARNDGRTWTDPGGATPY